MNSGDTKLRALGWFQGVFYGTTGIWPLLHIDSFMAVTGPKVDQWLVRTVGALLAWTGVLLCRGAWRKQVTSDLALLALGQALVLATIDIVYVAQGRISTIYLLDAAAETALAALWFWGFPRERNGASSRAAR